MILQWLYELRPDQARSGHAGKFGQTLRIWRLRNWSYSKIIGEFYQYMGQKNSGAGMPKLGCFKKHLWIKGLLLALPLQTLSARLFNKDWYTSASNCDIIIMQVLGWKRKPRFLPDCLCGSLYGNIQMQKIKSFALAFISLEILDFKIARIQMLNIPIGQYCTKNKRRKTRSRLFKSIFYLHFRLTHFYHCKISQTGPFWNPASLLLLKRPSKNSNLTVQIRNLFGLWKKHFQIFYWNEDGKYWHQKTDSFSTKLIILLILKMKTWW